jgi:acyl-CoA thioester hydrolase
MYSQNTEIRVRYGETDQMGFLYYGNYAQYYEVGRVETIRSLGISYKEMEESGIALPVLELKSKFIKPAYYDDLLTVKTTVSEIPDVRIEFKYEITNQQNELINIGSTTLVFFDTNKRRPCKAPAYVLEKLNPYFSKDA